jgi:hypothetical protein
MRPSVEQRRALAMHAGAGPRGRPKAVLMMHRFPIARACELHPEPPRRQEEITAEIIELAAGALASQSMRR